MPGELSFGMREWRLAYGVALRVLKAPDQAEDAAQEAILRAFRARDTFSGAARFEAWLHRIALTTALGFLRKPQYRRPHASVGGVDPLELLRASEPAQSPEDATSLGQLAECVTGCLRRMREADRLAFTERYLHGTSERELGRLLGVSVGAAKQRAFRARREVRRCVSQREQPPGGDSRPERPERRSDRGRAT